MSKEGATVSDLASCLNPTDIDVLVSRVRAHAAVSESGVTGDSAAEPPFSCRFKGIDSALRQDIDVALLFQAPFATPAAGRFRRLKGGAKDMLRRVWSWQSTLNAALVSATVGLSDKSTALVLEIENLERRVRELEARLDGPVKSESSNSDSAS
jgi:hypothetical protein